MPFRVATYNVLATAYLNRGNYRTPPELLRPQWRTPALLTNIQSFGADVLCLQEVEADVFTALNEGLSTQGHEGHYEPKAGGRPDGCATFYRRSRFTPRQIKRIEYHDREIGPQKHSGSIALIVTLELDGRLVGVANTHIRWDQPGTPRDRQIGLRETVELLTECRQMQPAVNAWITCGDFNCTPDSDVYREMIAADYLSAHATRPAIRSAVSSGKAKLIDFIFHTPALVAHPLDPPQIDDDSILPSKDQPSDHLPLQADLDWRTI